MLKQISKKVSALLAFTLVVSCIPFYPVQATITNGSNAVDLLGQYDNILLSSPQPQYLKSLRNDGPNLLSAGGPTAIDTVNHRFFLGNDNRVLVFNLNTDNTFPDKFPDNILGQSTLGGVTAATTQSGMGQTEGLAYDSTNNRLFVAQSTNNRVTVYDVSTITNGENAVAVLGQSTYTGGSAANSQSGMSSPRALAYDSTNQRLFVAQQGNNRVTVYDVNAITNGENAVAVLGQSTYTGASAANTSTGMNFPAGLAYDSTNQRLFVSNNANHRVTVYDVNSITNGEAAVNVLGQGNFTNSSSNVTLAGMSFPAGLAYDSTNSRLFVAQTNGNRVTAYDVTSITNGENAINVLGQSDFTSNTTSITQGGFSAPQFLTFDATNNLLFVGQRAITNRTSVFDVASITDGENAVDLLGQYDDSYNPLYIKDGLYNGPNKWGYYGPAGLTIDYTNHRLFVSDSYNNRVLVYNLNTNNTLPDKVPDYVLGQADFYSGAESISQSGMSYPTDLAFDEVHNRLFVLNVNGTAGRVLVYDTSSISNGENATHVLGQPNFTAQNAVTSQSGTKKPWSVAYDSTNDRLFLSDWGNRRVLVYDTADITDGEAAVNVLGQSNFTNSSLATTSTGLWNPEGVSYDSINHRLFVADSNNKRVLAYDVNSITNGEAAVNVLGQSNFTNNSAAVTQSGLTFAGNVFYDRSTGRVYVADGSGFFHSASGNNRIIAFDGQVAPAFTVTETDGSTDVIEGGATDTFSVSINQMPSSDVIFTISSTSASASVSSSTLTFTSSNWDTAQTVTVSAPEDANLVSEHPNISVSVDESTTDGSWTALASQTFDVNVTDNDTAGFTISNITSPVDINEGSSTTFDLSLNAMPDSPVVLDISSSNALAADISLSSVTFTSANWDEPQTITINALEDGNYDNENLNIEVSVNTGASALAFSSVAPQQIVVNTIDNDTLPTTCVSGGNVVCGSQDLQCPELSNTFGVGVEAPANFQISETGSRSVSSSNDTTFSQTENGSYFDNDNDSNYNDPTDTLSISSNTPFSCANSNKNVQLTVSATNFSNGSSESLLTYGADDAAGGTGSAADYYAMLSVITSANTTCSTNCTLAEGAVESNNGVKHGEENFFNSANANDSSLAPGFDNNSVLIDKNGMLNTITLYNNSLGFEGEIFVPGLKFVLALPSNPKFSGSFSSTITYTLNS